METSYPNLPLSMFPSLVRSRAGNGTKIKSIDLTLCPVSLRVLMSGQNDQTMICVSLRKSAVNCLLFDLTLISAS